MYGDEWPQGGEVDIIEGANTAHRNLISAHTAEGCSQDESLEGMSSGNQRNTECFIGDQNIGCGFDPPTTSANTYGDGFNAANGGVYAVQWDNEYVRVWHFVRDQIPGDIRSKTPNPESWGLPQAVFGGSSCDVDSYFKNMRLVINTVGFLVSCCRWWQVSQANGNRTSAVTLAMPSGAEPIPAATLRRHALNMSPTTLKHLPTRKSCPQNLAGKDFRQLTMQL